LAIFDTDSDIVLSRYISAESSKIESFCNRKFPSEKVSDTFRFSVVSEQPVELERRLGSVQLSRNPVTELTSVTEDGTLLTASQYELDTDAGLLYRLQDDSRIAWNCQKIVAIYTGGFTTLPMAVDEACVLLVKTRLSARLRDPMLRVDDVTGIGRTEYWVGSTAENFPPDVEGLLSSYRRFEHS
jgi:hypothetical protein